MAIVEGCAIPLEGFAIATDDLISGPNAITRNLVPVSQIRWPTFDLSFFQKYCDNHLNRLFCCLGLNSLTIAEIPLT
jgi:hypothetical protein